MPVQLSDGVWWLDLRGVNAYLADDDGVVTLVDAGPAWHRGAALQGLVDAGYTLADLDRVLVTHYDADHVGGLSRLGGLDVTVHAGAADAPLVAGEKRPNWRSRKGIVQLLASPLLGDPPVDVRAVTDGETLGTFTVYETPGHTPGHVAYVSESLDAAFLGDVVRESDGRLQASPWFMSADTAAVERSIRSLSARAPAFAVAGMGHGRPLERDGKRRLDELAERINGPVEPAEGTASTGNQP